MHEQESRGKIGYLPNDSGRSLNGADLKYPFKNGEPVLLSIDDLFELANAKRLVR